MSQVNLLPPELRARQALQRLTMLVVLAGAAVIGLILVFFVIQNVRLSGVKDDLAAQQQVNAGLQQQIAELQPYADLQVQLKAQETLVSTVYANEISWSGVLLDVSRIIPDESYLTGLTGQLTAPEGTPPGGAPLIGTLTFQGVAQQTVTISTWLTRLEEVDGWVNAWANSAQESAEFSRIYSFASAVDLTPDAATDRGRGEAQQR